LKRRERPASDLSDAYSLSRAKLAELAGHSSIATTQRYIDINDLMLRKAVELL